MIVMDNNNIAGVAGRMSNRLITVAEMLRGDKAGLKVADVGCDHGYVSIYLVQSGIASSAIAMDVRKGPLSGAQDNIRAYGLENAITTRLSDGVKELKKGEADSLIVAGMGGKLMISILDACSLRELGIETAVLQPQSDIPEFRQYLRDKGYVITDEKIIYEEGKYYFPMKVSLSSIDEGTFGISFERIFSGYDDISNEQRLRICNRFGEHNLIKKDSLLLNYLTHGREVCMSILKCLDEGHTDRQKEVEEELSDISFAIKYLDE